MTELLQRLPELRRVCRDAASFIAAREDGNSHLAASMFPIPPGCKGTSDISASQGADDPVHAVQPADFELATKN
jgi:hypothetical protein